MKKQCTMVIDVNGAGFGTVHVDGTPVKFVCAVSTSVVANEAPVVRLSLAIPDSLKVRYDGADLIVDNIVMPESVEIAIWRHLSSKYGNAREIDVTTLNSKAREWLRAGP